VSAGWVLVQTQAGAAPDVADTLAGIAGVELVDQVAGAYDVVARVADAGAEVASAKPVARAALRVPGVTLAICCHDGALSPDAPGGTVEMSTPSFAEPPQAGVATL
jgi:hypothetical protein